MKKNKVVKLSAATMLALSAITPVVAFANETEVTPDGFYTGTAFLPMTEFAAMSKSAKKTFLTENIAAGALVLVQNGKVYDMTDSNIQNAPADEIEGLGKTVAEYTEETGNTLTPDGIVAGEEVPPVVGELEFESVEATNPSTIELTFNKDVPEDFDKSLVTVKNLNVKDVTINGNKVVVNVSGAEFEKEYAVTYDGKTLPVKFGSVNQYYTLEVTTDATDTNGNTIDDIEASGKSTLLLTATVIDNATGEPIKAGIDGAVQFLTTAGALGQQQIVIQNGKASVQLKSVSSLETIYADITAKVVGGSALTGLVGDLTVEFKPKGEAGDVSTTVPVVKAQTETADRVTVVLGQPKPDLTEDELASIAAAATVTDSVKVATVAVKEARQISDSVVELVLDTYTAPYDAYLTDNAVHSVEFARVNNLLEPTIAPLSFKLTDSTKQFALGAVGVNQRTIEVRFDNPVAVSTASSEPWSALNIDNYVLDGKKLTAGTTIEVKPGTEGKVVVIKLGATDAIKVEQTILQVRNVGDWAAITDSANKITTQDLFLTTVIDDATPVITVSEDSPEQYELKFNKPVKATAALDTLIEARYGKVLDADQTGGLTGKKGDLETLLADVEFTALDEDGLVVADPTADEFSSILVELNKDWTEILGGASHWTAAPQIQFKTAKNVFYTDLNNKNLVTNIFATNARDITSPTIVDYNQADAKGDPTDGATVTFSEPVQLPGFLQASGVATTPNATQNNLNGDVQSPVVEFSLDGVVVEGELDYINAGDFNFHLTAGTNKASFDDLRAAASAAKIEADENDNYVWKVTVTGVSDDYGNTMATQEFDFVVPALASATPQAALEIDPFVVYADYDGTGAEEVITIKFSEIMANNDANGVSLVSNYILNSQQLTSAAGAQITKGIDGVTEAWDGVTITLPKGSVEAEDFMLTLPTNFKSADGQKLVRENVLNFVAAGADLATFTQDNGVLFTNSYDKKADNTVGLEEIIVSASATTTGTTSAEDFLTDLTIKIEFSDATAATAATTLQVLVNGEVVSADAIVAPTGTELEIEITDTTTLKAEELELEDGDVIEVKVNGQTMFVQAIQ